MELQHSLIDCLGTKRWLIKHLHAPWRLPIMVGLCGRHNGYPSSSAWGAFRRLCMGWPGRMPPSRSGWAHGAEEACLARVKSTLDGVRNVLRLKRANPRRVRDEFGVVLMRTVQELNGIPCQDLTEEVEPSKQVMSSRSFWQRVTILQALQEAITFHAATASARLREQGLYTHAVHCFGWNIDLAQSRYLFRKSPLKTNCSWV
jgi:hypothetical protein